jgi:two-component sensor histidine kinase
MEAYDGGAAADERRRFAVREANHRMMNMLAILLALFQRNFSKFSDQCVRGERLAQ